jgi:hypothetical protein
MTTITGTYRLLELPPYAAELPAGEHHLVPGRVVTVTYDIDAHGAWAD